jgi:hypothetical protein
MSKITFIYDHKPNEVWSTPLSLLNEFKERGWETEIIPITANDDSKLQAWIGYDTHSDIVMFMDWGRIDSKWLDKSLKPNSFWIQESGDDPQNFDRNSTKANRFDLTITPDYECSIVYEKMGVNCEWITHFADNRIHYPMNIKPKYIAVTTRGRGGSQFLDYLTDWSEGSIGNKNGMIGKEHTEFLNSGLMILQNSRWGEITRRIFEGMACGKMVITDRLNDSKKLHELFEENKEIVFYDDMKDCVEKINYYTNNESLRERIARAGYLKVDKNHTQKVVVDKLIKQYEIWKSSQLV